MALNRETSSFDLSIKVDGVPLKTTMKELEDWLEEKLQSLKEDKPEVFHREGNFRFLNYQGHFGIKVEISRFPE